MSENNIRYVSLTADGTLNAKRFGKVTSAGKLDECDTAGEKAQGIISGAFGTSISDGFRATLEFDGFPMEVECSGTVTAGEYVQTDTAGKAVTQTTGVALGYALTTATNGIVDILPLFDKAGDVVVSIPVNLATVADGDVVTTWTPGFSGTIKRFVAVDTQEVTTAAKLTTLNLEIGTTNVTGGAIALTSANLATLGAVVASSAITAANRFGPTDTISVEASSTTAFAEGQVVLLITIGTP